MRREDRIPALCSETFIDGDGPHICWGRILYRDIFGNDYETAWKHRVIRKEGIIKTEALAGGYSDEWKKTEKRIGLLRSAGPRPRALLMITKLFG
jgi:hypothetical protein